MKKVISNKAIVIIILSVLMASMTETAASVLEISNDDEDIVSLLGGMRLGQ